MPWRLPENASDQGVSPATPARPARAPAAPFAVSAAAAEIKLRARLNPTATAACPFAIGGPSVAQYRGRLYPANGLQPGKDRPCGNAPAVAHCQYRATHA